MTQCVAKQEIVLIPLYRYICSVRSQRKRTSFTHIQEPLLAKNYYSFDKRKKELAKKKKKEEKRLRKLERKKTRPEKATDARDDEKDVLITE